MNREDLYRKGEKEHYNGRIIQLLKFYLIPGWRVPEFSRMEFEIDKIRSKRRFFRHFLKPITMIGVVIFLSFIIIGIFAPWFTIYPLQELVRPYYHSDVFKFADPSPEHPLGTTLNGYDILGRLIWGARTTLIIALIPSIIAVGGGLILGTISAYFGGVVDWILMRIVDIMYALPTLIIIIILAPMMGGDLLDTINFYGLFNISLYTRFMRSLALQGREMTYIKAAKAGGASKFKIMFKHIAPNALSPMIIMFFGSMAAAILGITGLSYLGLGDDTVANWGMDIKWASIYEINAFFWPGLCTALTVIGIMLIGDGLRDALDPRLKL